MKLSKAQLTSIVASYVADGKISIDSFSATYNNSVGLLDTISKIFTIPSNYVDKLEMFNGEDLTYGKTIEEWKSDLILPEDYDEDGDGALAPHKSTYRPVSFSFTLGRKKIPQTIYNNDLERAVHNAEQFAELIADKTKAMYDSEIVFKYQMKRQALGVLIARCIAQMDASQATAWTDVAHSTLNALFKKDAAATDTYLLVKKYAQGDASSFADAVAKGYLIKMELVSKIAKPVDTSTGEDFVRQVKADVEIAGDISEGHSLNGNTLGALASEGLLLITTQGIAPVIDVDVQAGAFHQEKVALPAKQVVIPDFGNDTSGAYAILMDARGMRLFNSYRAVRENLNGDGDFLNLFYHTENTCHISRNTFVKVYKPAE